MSRLNRTIVFVCAAVLIGTGGIAAAVSSSLAVFNESFSGTGDYRSLPPKVLSGFDHGNWVCTSAGEGEVSFADGALRLSNRGQDYSYVYVGRPIGTGSFEQVIELRDVVLGNPNAPAGSSPAQIILAQNMNAGTGFQLLISENNGSAGHWVVSIIQSNVPLTQRAARTLRTTAPRGKDIALRVRWNQDSARVQIDYNHNTTGDEFITLADFDYTGAPLLEGSTSLLVQRSYGDGGPVSTKLDRWTMTPLAEE